MSAAPAAEELRAVRYLLYTGAMVTVRRGGGLEGKPVREPQHAGNSANPAHHVISITTAWLQGEGAESVQQ